MDGMEKIMTRIQEDADREIAQRNTQTDQQIQELQTQAQAQADRERGEILARGRRAAEERSAIRRNCPEMWSAISAMWAFI